MVAIKNIDDVYSQNCKTLGDWVKEFRMKRTQMKRKLRSGGNLRVCAILSTALTTAEFELRRKQQDRFQKWLDFQTKINKNFELQPRSELHNQLQRHQKSEEELVMVTDHQSEDIDYKQDEAVTNLWKCELSELDNFMRSISSSSKNNHSMECDNDNQKNIQTRSILRSS